MANLEVKKCGRALAPRHQKLNFFEAEWITCGCICTVRKEQWKDCCDFVDTECQKLIFLRNQAAITLSQLAKYASIVPSFKFILHDKPTVVLKHFFGNSLSKFCSH